MATIAGDGGGTTVAGGGLTFQAAVGWGILFLVFVAMTDVPITSQPAAMLAWLFFVSVLFKYGPQAFGTIQTVNSTKT
jgi:hypothetical protein